MEETYFIENNLFIWTELYRPLNIDYCILPDSMKVEFNGLIKKKVLPNLILKGTAGVGKTTIARALCEQLGCDYIIVNGSGGLNVDELRVRVTDFVTSVSLSGKRKCVLVDEADGMSHKVQDELRGFIEAHTKNVFFIFTCNFANKIITPIHSRCSVIDFRLAKEDKPAMAKKFMERVKEILKIENVTFDNKVLAQVVMNYFPDFRRTLNELQRYSAGGTIDAGILTKSVESDVSDLILTIKEKSFKKMRQWCENNSDGDFNLIYSKLFDSLLDQVNEVPQAVLIISEAAYREYFCVNKVINLVACCTELMGSVSFK
jgi:DNA polymerase III delta prime subunit